MTIDPFPLIAMGYRIKCSGRGHTGASVEVKWNCLVAEAEPAANVRAPFRYICRMPGDFFICAEERRHLPDRSCFVSDTTAKWLLRRRVGDRKLSLPHSRALPLWRDFQRGTASSGGRRGVKEERSDEETGRRGEEGGNRAARRKRGKYRKWEKGKRVVCVYVVPWG